MIEPDPLQQVNRTYVRFRGQKFSYFSGCDYFRLASHPKVLKALSLGLKRYGLNVAASRLTTGNHILYRTLEERLARFFEAQTAVLVANGYLTNLVVTQALAREISHGLIDEAAHPSLKDAARGLTCPVRSFKHRDADDLKRVAQRCGQGAKLLVLTDGMFSSDGSTPPLKQYLEVLPRTAIMLVDDAHAAGVLGKTGKGSLEHHGVNRKQIIQTITLSKAFGVFGGAVLGSLALRQNIIDRSGAFIGSTPLPLPLANAAHAAVNILEQDRRLKKRLVWNTTYVRNRLRQAGLELENTPGPIIQIVPSTETQRKALNQAFLKEQIYPPFMTYPGATQRGFFRFAISSEHTRTQLDALVRAICKI